MIDPIGASLSSDCATELGVLHLPRGTAARCMCNAPAVLTAAAHALLIHVEERVPTIVIYRQSTATIYVYSVNINFFAGTH